MIKVIFHNIILIRYHIPYVYMYCIYNTIKDGNLRNMFSIIKTSMLLVARNKITGQSSYLLFSERTKYV